MSVTLSIPPTIVEEIRVWANSAGTSLNQYIRDCLEAKAHEIRESRQREAKEFFSFCNENLVHAPKGWRYNRERDGVRQI